MHVFFAALGVFGICCISADIEMGPLSKFNTNYLIRPVNSTLELYCRSTSNVSAELLITHCKSSEETSCKNLTTEKGPGSKEVVKFPSLKFSDSGSYTCRDVTSYSSDYISLSVRVKPQPPKNMDCISPDLKELSCTWNKSDSLTAPTKWKIWYKWKPVNVGKYSEVERCPDETQSDFSMTCRWEPCQSPDCSFAAMREYRVYVTGSSPLGNANKTFDIAPEHYAKLTVQRLQLRTTATSLVARWTLDEELFLSIPHFTLDFVASLEDPTSKLKISNWTINPNNETDPFKREFPGLYPFTRYKFCLKVKLSGSRGFWSELACDEVVTNETAPLHAPKTDRWAFYVDGDQIQLYLKEVLPNLRTSKEYWYAIQGLDGGHIATAANSTITIPASRVSKQGPLLIRSCNDMGCSNASTPINTDKMRTEFRPRSVIVTKKTDSYTASCDVPEKFRKEIQFTIFYYCRGHRENNICLSNFNWERITGAESNLKVRVPSDEYGDWVFGVSFVAHDNTSGGILFANCYSSSNKSCTYDSTVKVEHTSDKIFTIILVVFPSVTLILIAFLILRYLKQRHCEEIKIELPVLFQMKNNHSYMAYDSQNVVDLYKDISTKHTEHREATVTRTVDNEDKSESPENGSSKSTPCAIGVVDYSFNRESNSFMHDTVLNQEVNEDQHYFLDGNLSSSCVSIRTHLNECDKNDGAVFDRSCGESYKGSLISLKENYVTNEDYIENKQDLKEEAKHSLDVLPSEYARCVASDDLCKYYTQSEEVISFAESHLCSNKNNNGDFENSTLIFDTKSFSDDFMNPEPFINSASEEIKESVSELSPFLNRSSLEFKESVTMHPEYVH